MTASFIMFRRRVGVDKLDVEVEGKRVKHCDSRAAHIDLSLTKSRSFVQV